MKKHFLLVFAILFFGRICTWGQDQHFTQFYASPLSLNPALAGAFDGKYRVSFIYRDQWRNVLDNPYLTYSTAIDLRFGVDWFGPKAQDALGIGMIFYSDKNSGTDFSTNQINVAATYHKSLGARKEQYLSLGFQAGIAQRNISYENLTFNDQFNGADGYTGDTREIFPENNFSFADYAVGLNYSYTPRRKTAIFAGAAMHHILEPQVGFYYDPDEEPPSNEHNLHRKYSAYLSFQIPIAEKVQLLPRALFYSQGPHFALNAGTNFRFLINENNGVALHIGSWVRPVRYEDESMQLDAVIGMVGIEYNSFLLGVSYDATLNQLNLARSGQGAIEISIAYLGEYENETIQCPQF